MADVVLENLSKHGDAKAVDNVSLKIEDHELITLLGPSGSGKSTARGLIAGLERPTSGKLFIDGTLPAISQNLTKTARADFNSP